ncbi:DNA glycosylase [Podospora fimiseda]|uniref:DNA glycosylase n=1 Tax=Podospora fimiseda TaxID=252190 RepID=A0AAN7BHE0_9PEZI|nr:DNA glycosylase [Podospora fimiseda]
MRTISTIRIPKTMAPATQRRQPSRTAKLSTTPPNPGNLAVMLIKEEPPSDDDLPLLKVKRSPLSDVIPPKKRHKTESPTSLTSIPPITSDSTSLSSKKLLAYTKHTDPSGPFPLFPHPTPSDCLLALNILSSLHGARHRPKPATLKAPSNRAGCGDSPSVLDALVRTILSQNTSDQNSSRAKKSMDTIYGRSDNWDAIVQGGQAKLEETIKCGGLGAVKSKCIYNLLQEVKAKHGEYSLESLRKIDDNDMVMKELLGFKGIGPKTASCVMLFSLGRESFAVDTHVWRISGLIGWRPGGATRDETHLHLDRRIPGDMKFGLHVLMVTHGKRCEECKAGGVVKGRCKLRKAFEGAVEDRKVKE